MSNIPDTKLVIELAQRLERAREELKAIESEWAVLFGLKAPEKVEIPQMPLPDRIRDFLEIDIHRAYTASDVAFSLDANHNSVSSILSRLVKEHRIEKRGHSHYGAKRTHAEELGTIGRMLESQAVEEEDQRAGARFL